MPKKTRKEQNDISPSTNKTRRKLKVIRPIIQETQPQPQSEPIVDTIVNALSALNPFRNAPVEVEPIKWQEPAALTGPVPVHGPVHGADANITCEDKRCPVGYRCDDNKVCYKLKDIELVSNGQRVVLSVDDHRKKTYDIDLLTRNFDRVFHLKNGKIDGKRITGTLLKTVIDALKTRVKGDTKSTYYGTLNDELIIQVIYLEEMERNENAPVIAQLPAPPSPEPTLPPTEITIVASRADPTILDEGLYKLPETDITSTANENDLQNKIGIPPDDVDSKEYNTFMREKELAERNNINLEDTYDFLYPELNDPNFNIKIAKRKEFQDTQYDGKIYDVKAQAEQMCNADFELMPHQLFVKNFLSFQTPYNSLLLYHGLGTGKTCSAIGIAEEMRSYMKQTGGTQRIMIIASPNVQNNFRQQIFDERKLMMEGGNWNLNTCIGNALLKEINPSQVQNMPRDKVISQINSLITQYYTFMGYGELANYIKRNIATDGESGLSTKQQKQQEIGKIQALFNNRLVIIDEVHNIRIMQDNKEAKKTASLLMRVCKYAENMRLLLLSATPVFNDPREIIWLTNLLNAVDKRGQIDEKDVFTRDGEFVKSRTLPDGTQLEDGEELLRRKLTGYVSYVRGENPYTFPYRIYPVDFAPGRQLQLDSYPSTQMNKKAIETVDKPSKTPLYMDPAGEYQKSAYNFIIEHLLHTSFSTTDIYGKEREMPSFENMESFGYTQLREPLQSLNIIYPSPAFDAFVGEMENPVGEEDEEESVEESTEEVVESPENTESVEEPTEEPSTEELNLVESQAAKEFAGGNGENNTPDAAPVPIVDVPNADVAETSEDEDEDEDEADDEADESAEVESVDESTEDKSAVETVDEETLAQHAEIINNMIGKEGLSTVMLYEQTRTPFELRHNFKYQPDIMSKYGKIFHPDNIQKYSGKIASICKIIKESTGIVMVYSQFIDGGVVPIALALEEMGFTRYGFASHTKSLFETAPTAQVDATTFKTLAETEDKSTFHPAKYVMITGDKSFSPNNLADLKHVTGPSNKHGEQVRVVLITKAAAEGLDFKNIRQLHVLEPWYNMNRVEQIIGRGVRNLSHCMLPFEERNVEIYLHATAPDGDAEPADLYVYRYAEKKAIQIGTITRILKEVAVDCILNIGQTSFTLDKLNSLAENQNIKLRLSSNQEIDYKIGDREGSGICDYMNCDFVCSPTTVINPEDINNNTYGEHYVKMNYNAIAKRIRDVFREQPFYSRTQLLASIQILRTYPIEQIDYVLSMFTENPYNYIVDKYGRSGYLINAGDYYGFQPLEITDEQSSVFDRTAPVDYKPNEMYMELPLEKEGARKQLVPVLEVDKPDIPNFGKIEKSYESLVNELKSAFVDIDAEKVEHAKGELMHTAESDWYKHMGHVYDELENHVNIPTDMIDKYIVYHWIDMQLIEHKLIMLYHLFKSDSYIPTYKHESSIKSYFAEKMFMQGTDKCIALGGNNHIELYIQVLETRQWKKAAAATVRKYKDELRKKYHIEPSQLQSFVGFMHLFKKNEMTFKMKEIVKQPVAGKHAYLNKGFKCSVMGKSEIVKFLNNKVLAKNPYFSGPGKGEPIKYDVNTNAKNIMRIGLCVMMEIIMRYFNDSPNAGNQKWFLDVEETLANDLPKL
jgi:hypothetical protein